MTLKEQQKISLWAEINRVQKLLGQMQLESSILKIDITNDKLYISLNGYIAGLRRSESLIRE
jgi:hypothetical protein